MPTRRRATYPPIGGPDGGAYVTVGDLLRFHQAVAEGRLLGPVRTAELLSPKARHSARGAGSHLMGFGFEFETDADDVVQCNWKEGVNVGQPRRRPHATNPCKSRLRVERPARLNT